MELFERPFVIYLILGVIELVLMLWWRGQMTPRRWASLAAAPALAGAVCLTAWLVVTDRERIEGAINAIVADANAGSTSLLGQHLAQKVENVAPGDRLTAISREEVITIADQALANCKPGEIRVQAMRVDFPEEGTGRMQLTASVVFQQGPLPGRMLLSWVICWKKEELRWKMFRIELTRMGLQSNGRAGG